MAKEIKFTDRALKQIKKITTENKSKKYFRISVKGGGCSGFKYNFSFDSSTKDDDVLFNNTIIDKASLEIINGSIIFVALCINLCINDNRRVHVDERSSNSFNACHCILYFIISLLILT